MFAPRLAMAKREGARWSDVDLHCQLISKNARGVVPSVARVPGNIHQVRRRTAQKKVIVISTMSMLIAVVCPVAAAQIVARGKIFLVCGLLL